MSFSVRSSPFLLAFLCIYFSPAARAQSVPSTDSMLITNMNLQMEIAKAINDMYNFKFGEARRQFNGFKDLYKEHPLPYFLLGLNIWWQMMPALEVEKYDEEFEAYMDSAIMKAKKLYDIDRMKVEGAFFLSASYGFKARLYSERKKWLKAAGSANKSLNYLDDCRGKNDLSPELLFGDGLYNYFSVWIPENYPQLRPFLIMFTKGNKELGLEQLREVAHNSFYTRTEAQYWLMRILFTEENDYQGALHESEYLYTTFPDNAYFERYYARLLFQTGRYARAKSISENLLARVDSGMIGYESTSGRYACFYLARIYESGLDMDNAFNFYKRTVNYSEQAKAYESAYYHYSLLGLARIYDKRGDKKEAEKCLKLIRKYSKGSDEVNKLAKDRLKSLKDDGD